MKNKQREVLYPGDAAWRARSQEGAYSTKYCKTTVHRKLRYQYAWQRLGGWFLRILL